MIYLDYNASTAIEHPVIVEPCRYLQRHGVDVTFVGVDSTGLVGPGDVAATIRPETVLASGMHANNEVGTIQTLVVRLTEVLPTGSGS